ncbi:hypothetical protein F4774DRAFT_385510 [Daldinia eschscholtzii]|nr:hypothetical protein F4774DRAFT_385510 [Daldinia eschscholtzii]
MAGSPQLETKSAFADKAKPTIYDAAKRCEKGFEDRFKAIEGKEDEYPMVEELWGGFNQWAAYVGAFALEKASLDARLFSHDDYREMVLELLFIIQENLQWASIPRTYDYTEEVLEESNSGLPAVRAGLDQLLVISSHLRRPTSRNNRFRQANQDNQDNQERLCDLLMKAKYPNARTSLRSQLATSIHQRGISLQYMQQHNEKLAHQRHSETQRSQIDRLKEQAKPPTASFHYASARGERLPNKPCSRGHRALHLHI